MRQKTSRARDRDASSIASVRRYYRITLPFYEDETEERGDLPFWKSLAREWAPRRVLELGCGLARVARVLSGARRTVGLDLSLEMLARASRRMAGGEVWLVCADARRFAFSQPFDLIVAPNDPLSHWTRTVDRRAILSCAARHLAAGGRFVLDGLYIPRRTRVVRAPRAIGAGNEVSVREVWEPRGTRNLWLARYFYRTGAPGVREVEASFRARSWLSSEVRPLFASCGLAVEELWGDVDHAPFRADSPRLLVVARRLEPALARPRRAATSSRRYRL